MLASGCVNELLEAICHIGGHLRDNKLLQHFQGVVKLCSCEAWTLICDATPHLQHKMFKQGD